MEISKLRTNLDQIMEQLKSSVDDSINILDNGNIDKKEVYKAWEGEVREFLKYSINRCEESGNSELIKMITKTLIFGR